MSLEERFEAEIRALIESGAGVPFVFNPGEAFMLLSTLQLALRHPGMNGSTAEWIRALAENIEERVCITPALQEIARRGWNPEFDVTLPNSQDETTGG